MRTGPKPLSIHIGMAASHWPLEASRALAEQGRFVFDLQTMMLGIQKYHLHPYYPVRPETEEVWSSGQASMLKLVREYDEMDRPAVLLVPSLINKSYVMNLSEQRSLMTFLYEQGCAPYLLDWGEPLQDQNQQSLDDVVAKILLSAAQYLLAETKSPIHALGYCMGGTLLACAAAQDGTPFKSLTFLAAPWDFHAGSQKLLQRVQFWAPMALTQIKLLDKLPVDWIQGLFALLDPALSIRKFTKFYHMDSGGAGAKLFVSIEDWLNDGVDLSADLATTCVQGWFLNNMLATDGGSRLYDPAKIKTPSLFVSSSEDHLVEPESAQALKLQMEPKNKHTRLVDPKCGHIGMIAGKNAVENVWQPIADWIIHNR